MPPYQHYKSNFSAMLSEYAQNIIEVPEEQRWKYAIPDNYTNYHDGFICQNGAPYRGLPILDYNGTILYLFRIIELHEMDDDAKEKMLLFDRHGNKYTFVVRPATAPMPGGNPSYWEFIKRVKKYTPRRKNGGMPKC